jgi:histidyl-tRNA synthetase
VCFVVTVGPETAGAGVGLVSELRAAGVPTAAPYEERPLKAQLKMADRAGAEFVAIVGAKELAAGAVTLRRLVDGVQKTVPAADVVSWLTRLDGWTD